ncbi:uncharacterized protein BO88DRAFT_221106 [Aspergillus vadensis CBS 113365]|uniref:Uncharacterized protein n=1 Tax=Aspergillus vadensis (strain CBS 113365 / IMI 142717 / IBT 24658) TaxID=1448311 RepID=A0A319AUP8_ASPVC|nr:hypothetical protein BO88DRAFT_221106 [Aspergillus vadensis CBS 113365]PYH63405.1 hypothetical protein BO88DRAFT_221106 [Aspergillus vadensis CBS 113365]
MRPELDVIRGVGKILATGYSACMLAAITAPATHSIYLGGFWVKRRNPTQLALLTRSSFRHPTLIIKTMIRKGNILIRYSSLFWRFSILLSRCRLRFPEEKFAVLQ